MNLIVAAAHYARGLAENTNGHRLAVVRNGNKAVLRDERIRLARLKGYEGDPCSECGQLTLIRSGACWCRYTTVATSSS